jgi:cobalt/nickel transport system ATP-binding protein
MSNVFDVQRASFDYEGIVALRDITLRVEGGQRVALVGANGSGKSTLLRLLDGLCFPSSGSIAVFGKAITPSTLQDDEFAFEFRKRVALVFQNPDVQLFNPTVFDEVAFGPLQLRLSREEILRRVGETMEFMGISQLKDRPPHRLSGGEKKRVALASALVLDPEVLLLDEPTSALDPKSQSQLIDLIQSWRSTSKTVVTATHQLDIVEDIADIVYIVQEGTIVGSGKPSEILGNSELLLRANLVHAHRHSHGGVVHSHPHSHRHSHHEHGHAHEHTYDEE